MEAATPEQNAIDAGGTPEEQAEGNDTAGQPDQSTAAPDLRVGQAEYTRSQQAFSALKAELGLDRSATREDVLDAVAELRNGPAGEDEGNEVDPKYADLEARLWESNLNVQAAIYGEDMASQIVDLINLARETDDPAELVPAFAAFRAANAAAGDEVLVEEEAQEAPTREPRAGVIETSDGDPGPSAGSSTSAPRTGARRESGTQNEIRRIFSGLGIGSQPPS